jgi:hypothetical protein
MTKDELNAELASLVAQADIIDNRKKEIRTEISRIELEERNAERQKKIDTATHVATLVTSLLRSSYEKETFVRETKNYWIDVFSGDRYKKSRNATESESKIKGKERFHTSRVRLRDIKPKEA